MNVLRLRLELALLDLTLAGLRAVRRQDPRASIRLATEFDAAAVVDADFCQHLGALLSRERVVRDAYGEMDDA